MKMRDLFESPISDISHVGNWEKGSSFRDPRDRKLLTSEKALTKIKAQWKYPEETMLNIILVNSADANKWTEEGNVTREWLAEKMPRDWAAIEPLLKDNEVNIIYTNNKGSERVPLTGWVMAHRFAHTLEAAHRRGHGRGGTSSAYYFGEACSVFASTMKEIMSMYGIRDTRNQYYRSANTEHFGLQDIMPLRAFCHEVGTFRSAREKNIRNPMEFMLELFAQYVFTGDMKFNDPPMGFRYGRNHYGLKSKEDFEYAARHLADMAYQLREYFEAAVGYADGEIFLM